LNSPNYNNRDGGWPLVVCIDGGPCSGKSSVLSALETERFDVPTVVIPELATIFGEELLAKGTDYPRLAVEDRAEYLRYQRRIVGGYIERIGIARQEMVRTGGLIITDRGPAGVRSYMEAHEWPELLAEFDSDPEAIKHDYADAVIFLDSLAVTNRVKYEMLRATNPLRTETPDQARDLHNHSLTNWQGHARLRRLGGDDVEDKRHIAKSYITELLIGTGLVV
jgi:predicted ATPase